MTAHNTPTGLNDVPAGLDEVPSELSHAGAVVDQAIGFMTGQNISSIAIASALLGGALGMLTRSLDDESVERILSSAIASVRAGEFRTNEGKES